jgi:LysM repeat protein
MVSQDSKENNNMVELTFDQLSPEEKEAVVSFYNSQGQDIGTPITEVIMPPVNPDRQTLSPPPVDVTSLDTGEPVDPPILSWRDMVVATEVSPTRGIMTDGPDMDEVQAFQERNGLPRDGVLDENTFRAMSAQALGQTQAPDGPPVAQEDPTQPAPTEAPVTYTIQGGDTLSKIASENTFTLDQLKAANPDITNFNNVMVGQEINLPVEGAPVVETPAVQTPVVEAVETTEAVADTPEATTPTPPSQSVIRPEDDETMKAYSAATSAGRRSLQDIEGIVLHHTHGSRPSTVEQYMRVGLDREVGAPFFIDVDGVVHQVAPLEEIIQHTSGTRSTVGEYRTPRGARYSSGNTIGIEIDATWDYNRNVLREGPNEAQKNALNRLVNELLPKLNATRGPENQLNIENSVFAHPELQAKMEDEATGVLNWLRVNNGFNEMRAIDRSGDVQLSPRPQARQGN